LSLLQETSAELLVTQIRDPSAWLYLLGSSQQQQQRVVDREADEEEWSESDCV